MQTVSQTVIRQFNNSQFFRMHLAALGGFVLGAKSFDLLFFRDDNYEVIREEMEEEYWAKNGEPTEIEPYIVPSKKPGNEGQLRKSWIYIMYEKDKLVKKSIDLDK